MENSINNIIKYGEIILLGMLYFWGCCAVIFFIVTPFMLKNVPLMEDDFDVKENILRKRK